MKPPAPKPNQKFHVLIIDDDMGRAQLLLANLEALNMECRHAANGVLGLQAFREEMPHLVLLDVMMPGLNGYEVCVQMRATSTVPILLLNESSTDENVMKGLKLGADDYIIKSMHEQVLSAHVIAWLRRVYQYDQADAPPVSMASASNVPVPNGKVGVIPNTANSAIPASEMARTQINPPAGWLRCESCGYMGPRGKFEQPDKTDKRRFCPACHGPLRTSHAL